MTAWRGDVTEQAQQRLRIARLSSIREVLSAVNNAIVRIRDRDELLNEACRIAVELGGMKLARAAVLEPENGKVSIAAVRGEHADLYASPEQMRLHGFEPGGGAGRRGAQDGRSGRVQRPEQRRSSARGPAARARRAPPAPGSRSSPMASSRAF